MLMVFTLAEACVQGRGRGGSDPPPPTANPHSLTSLLHAGKQLRHGFLVSHCVMRPHTQLQGCYSAFSTLNYMLPRRILTLHLNISMQSKGNLSATISASVTPHLCPCWRFVTRVDSCIHKQFALYLTICTVCC